jgi:hypothetical protein
MRKEHLLIGAGWKLGLRVLITMMTGRKEDV